MMDADSGGPRIPHAVVLMAYGTPRQPDEIEAYYTDIRRGRPPTPEQLADLTARYQAIGGVSPLAVITEGQRDALQQALDRLAPGDYEVRIGLKHARPSIEDTVTAFVDDGHRSIVALVLAPHESVASTGQYLDRVHAAAGAAEVHEIRSWATEPAYVDFLAQEVSERLALMPSNTKVVFTAHSLPQRVVDQGDGYVDQLRATASAVAERAGLSRWSDWSIAWQSAGRTPEPWLGPDILAVIDDLAAAEAADGLLVCACGFVADHLEVLYDLDIEARSRAESLGLVFDRTASLNDRDEVMTALARRVIAAAT